MTDQPGRISRIPERGTGTLYDQLRAEAIAMVQTMSGDVWTDYNYSDPGVTIIEQLAYALTELPYRALLPVAELLAEPGVTRVPLRQHALFPAWSILPCNPVTIVDLRRLLIDRVEGVGNVWVVPASTHQPGALPGLFDIRILAQSEDAGEALIEDVRRCYVSHRNLGEDIRHIRLLRPVETDIDGQILIAHDADPDDVMANALFALTKALAPEPQRLSFADWRTRQRETTALFDGPLMLRGFIAQDALGDEPRCFAAEDLATVLAAVPGVLAVDELGLSLEGAGKRYTGFQKLQVPQDSVLQLRTSPYGGRDGAQFPIRMIRNGRQCKASPARVRRKLGALWSSWRQTWPLRSAYTETYPTPSAQHQDLAHYTSVQEQFPLVYGIGPNGLPRDTPAARRAAARQLKGYLMPFDQTLANSFAQLAFMRRLLSIEAGGNATYACQSLRPIVPDVEPLIGHDYERHLHAVVAETDPVARRRIDALGVLMGFLGLRWALPPPPATDQQTAEAEIEARQNLLRRAAMATRDRGRGLDYLRSEQRRRLAETEMLSRIELGLLDRQRTHADTTAADAATDGMAFLSANRDGWLPLDSMDGDLDPESFGLDSDDMPADAFDLADPDRPPQPLPGDPNAYRIGRSGDDVIVVVRDSDGRWWLVARFDEEEDARRVLAILRSEAGDRWRRRFTLVDWVLLRHAAHDACHAPDYAMRATAVLSAHEDDDDDEWSVLAQQIIRANTPAHIALDCLFLKRADLKLFDDLHRTWRQALAKNNQHKLAAACRQLEAFLTQHLGAPPHPEPAPPCDDPATDKPRPPHDDPDPDDQPPGPPDPPDAPTPPQPTPPAPPITVPPEDDDPPAPSLAGRLWRGIKALVRLFFLPLIKLLALFAGLWALIRRLGGHRDAPEPLPEPVPLPEPAPPGPAQPLPQPPSSAGPIVMPPQPEPPAQPVAPALPGGGIRAMMATLGARGFDCDVPITPKIAAAFKAAGFAFVCRYLSRERPLPGDLDAAEAQIILSAGLALMPIQHVPPTGIDRRTGKEIPPWHPSASLGHSYGTAAAQQAIACGLPRDICVWLDLEAVPAHTPTSDIVAYCNAWFDAVRGAGFSPGLYVGGDCGLDSHLLGTALNCHYFWRSGSAVPDVAGTGYCMKQTIDNAKYQLAGVHYDLDVILNDNDRKRPIWAVAGAVTRA